MIAEPRTLSWLAVELRIDRRTLARELEGLPPDTVSQGKGRADRRWLLARVVEHLRGNSQGDGYDAEAELGRLRFEQANKTALENAVRSGQLLDVGLVYRAWEMLLVGIRARMLSVPTKLAAELAVIQDSNAIRSRLTDEITEILAEAAAHRAEPADLDGPDIDESGGEDSAAATPADRKRVGRRKAPAKSGKQRRAGAVAH
jgi:phage terminase Nu1 subunit (DNA packaging protein)